jgi:hypothetical protein
MKLPEGVERFHISDHKASRESGNFEVHEDEEFYGLGTDSNSSCNDIEASEWD